MLTAPESPATVTGVGDAVVFPLPRSPEKLSPQHTTVPAERSAQAWATPAARVTAAATPETATGLGEPTNPESLPSCPLLSDPQQATEPFPRLAQEDKFPPATIPRAAVVPVTPVTVTGIALGSKIPSPS